MDDGKGKAGPVTWQIELTPTAVEMLSGIKDVRERQKIAAIIDGLAHEPEKQGKELAGSLADFRSIRAAGQRYRIIYQLKAKVVVVLVIAVGRRQEGSKRDIYRLAQRLVRLATQEQEDEAAEQEPETAAEETAVRTDEPEQ